MSAPNLDNEQLVAALRAGAAPTAELAAIELLAWHGTWLRRREIRDNISVETDPHLIGNSHTAVAHVGWTAVETCLQAGVRASTAEHSVLEVAASLADGRPVDLRDVLTGLGWAHAAAVALAVLQAADQAEASVCVRQPPQFQPDLGGFSEPTPTTFGPGWPPQ